MREAGKKWLQIMRNVNSPSMELYVDSFYSHEQLEYRHMRHGRTFKKYSVVQFNLVVVIWPFSYSRNGKCIFERFTYWQPCGDHDTAPRSLKVSWSETNITCSPRILRHDDLRRQYALHSPHTPQPAPHLNNAPATSTRRTNWRSLEVDLRVASGPEYSLLSQCQ